MITGNFRYFGAWLSVAALLVGTSALAQQSQPDNTKVNKQDQSASRVTPDKQSNEQSDLAITRDIRRAIVADKSLSTYAHNVKIVTKQGQVTIRGPVRTEQEKQSVDAKAAEVAGQGHVTSNVTVAPSTNATGTKPGTTSKKPVDKPGTKTETKPEA